MLVAEWALEQIHWIIRKDPWVRSIFLAAGNQLDGLAERILALYHGWNFETMPESGLARYEELLGISPPVGSAVEDRRRAAHLRWLSGMRPSLDMIQQLCDAWEPGRIRAGYVPGSIILWFQGLYGRTEGTGLLESAIEVIKPAHLSLDLCYRFLQVKEVHRQMSVSELNATPLNHFAGGSGCLDLTRGSGILCFGDTLIIRKILKASITDTNGMLSVGSTLERDVPEDKQIGDGLWAVGEALTVAAASRIRARAEGETMYITFAEEG